jgi:gliding motility-associated-like protein
MRFFQIFLPVGLKCSKPLRAMLLVWSLFFGFMANAQLPDFDLDVDIEHETCPGNGKLTFIVANTTPGATFLFSVYHNPDMEVPISSSPDLTVDGLSAGTYTVVALETLGPDTNTQEMEVVIEAQIMPLTYTISSTTHDCSVGGEITIATLTGIAAQYEIISGPVMRPLQDSNVFPDLPEGMYNIRVFNNCGQAVVTTYTLEVNPAPPEVSQPIFDDVLTSDCDTVTITNTVSYPEGTVISYPLTVTYTINLPGGEPPQTVTMDFETGAPSLLEFTNEFPLIEGEDYTYDLLVTNSCGIQFGNNGMATSPPLEIKESLIPIPCGRYYFSLGVTYFKPPFTLDFSAVPDGFDPAGFGNGYPGPFAESPVTFGNDDIPVPFGDYIVMVTDACGRTASRSFTVEEILPIPSVSGRNNGCFSLFGRIVVSIPDRKLVFAEIIAAPPAYTFSLPNNVSSFINSSGILNVTNLPLGFYTLRLIDECGTVYENIVVEVPPFMEQDFNAMAFADCTVGIGAVRVASGNGKLTALTITDAPAAFGQTLPFDVTASITTAGVFFMDDLPAGNYTFHGTDICGIQRTIAVTVTGYLPATGPSFSIEPHCSAFDIKMFDADTSSGTPGYWLQMEDPDAPGQWMHPGTGVVYTEGTLPDSTNSLPLANNQENVNLLYFGAFRIIKAFESVGNAAPIKICFEVMGDFNYYDGVNIQNIYNISCLLNTDDIYVEATGLDPLNYRIESKDGMPFFLDNGTDNVFSGLATGSYQFVVEDDCGHIGRRTENINLLPELAHAHDPGSMLECIQPGQPASFEFDLSQQNAGILGDQSPSVYTITYHISEEDADEGINALPTLYTNTSNPQIVYARLVHNHVTICHDIVAFGLQVSEYPELHMDENVYVCVDGDPVTLTADPGFDSYVWSTGETTNSVEAGTPGVYSVTVANVYGDRTCEVTVDITVAPSEAASIVAIETDDWTDYHNSITILVNGSGQYEYSIDGVHYQDGPVFSGLETGVYDLYIRDKNGCGVTIQEFYLLNYPKFFTPNGDGVNDTWRIPFSSLEPEMEIFIFDRYGKFIVSFPPESPGWDGTYNGRPLPSTDYWFLVKRKDGKEHRGHFTMKR